MCTGAALNLCRIKRACLSGWTHLKTGQCTAGEFLFFVVQSKAVFLSKMFRPKNHHQKSSVK